MSEINENKCEHNAKEICCKMQKDSLRAAIKGLKENQDCSNNIREILRATYSVLSIYKCPPRSCLLERVDWVEKTIRRGEGRLYISEKVNVNMLIAELEAFVNN